MGDSIGLSVVIKAIDMITAPMKKIGQGILSALPGPAGAAVTAVAAIGAAAIAVGSQAVKMAGDFQAGTTTLVTGAGESAKNIGMIRDGILNMAITTGTTTKQLTNGMFMIESAGFHGAAGLQVLKAAAMGAKVGNADLGVVSDATTTIMNDFGISSGHASVAVNTMIATVANGKTTMQALAGSLSSILPTASAAGVGLNDTMAAMSTMTGEGVKASNAATYLRQTILGLVAPSKGTVTALKAVGLSSTQVSDEMKKSLPGALQMITDAVAKKFPPGSAAYVNALKNISGGAKTMQGMLDLTGAHLATFKSNVVNIAGAVKSGGNSITGWALVQQDWNQQMAVAHERVEVLMIKIGGVLIPILQQLGAHVGQIINKFLGWLTSGNRIQNILSAVGTAIQATGAFIASNLVPPIQHLFSVIWPLISGFATWIVKSGILAGIFTVVKIAIGIAIIVIGQVIDKVATAISIIEAIVTKIIEWRGVIMGVASVILAFFLPRLIQVGVQAGIAGVKLAVSFIKNIVATGVQSVIAGGKMAISFTKNLIASGVEGWKAAGKLLAYIGNLIKSGVQAVIAGAKIAASFIWSLIQTGAKAVWAGAQVVGSFVASMVTSAAKAVWAAAQVTASFIASMIKAGLQAAITAGQFVASLIPAIISFATEALSAAATAIPAILAGFASWAVGAFTVAAANIAAFWPVYLVVGVIIGVIALVVLAVKNWGAIAKWLQGVWSGIKSFFVGLWNGIVGLFQGAVSKLGGLFNVLKIVAMVALAPIVLPIMGIIALIQHWGQIMGWLGGIVKGAIGAIGGMVSGALSWITGLFTSAEDKAKQAKIAAEMHSLQMKDNVLKNAEEMSVKSVAAMTTEARGIEQQLEHCKSASERKRLEIKLAAIKHAMAERVAVVHQYQLQREAIAQHMKKLQQEDEEAHKNIFQHAWDWTTRMVQGVQQKFQGMKDWINGLLKGLINDLLKVWKNISDGVQNGLGGLGKLVQGIWKGVTDAFKGAIDWIISGINSFIGAINGISIPIPAINVGPIHLGGGNISLPKIPTIPLLASGGVITAAGLAGIHDRGAEVVKLPTGAAVYPHGSVPAESVGGGGVVNNYYNQTFNIQSNDPEKVYKYIKDRMSREMRKSHNMVTMSSGGRAAT